MSSFLFGTEYSTDQISAGSDNIRDYLNMDDSNELSQINAIRDKEMRLFKKLNSYTPTCESNKNRKYMDYCQQSVYVNDGMNLEKLRQDIINDIENKYFLGREIRVRDCIPDKTEKIQTEGFNNFNNLQDKISEIEKKNDMLLLFIFFLVIVVIIQYTKNIDKMQVMMMPMQNTSMQNTSMQNTPMQNMSMQNTPMQNMSMQNTSMQNTYM